MLLVANVFTASPLYRTVIKQLRWDKANLTAYKESTGHLMNEMYTSMINCEASLLESPLNVIATHVNVCIDQLTSILHECAACHVPLVGRDFFKFWWSTELSQCKRESVDAKSSWNAMGRPRSGPYFARWQSARLKYRAKIRESKRKERTASCEPLNAAFINCNITSFWKNWRNRFSKKAGNPLVDNVCEPTIVADKFAVFS